MVLRQYLILCWIIASVDVKSEHKLIEVGSSPR